MIGAYLIFWPMHYEGLAGMPRRYYDYSVWESFKQFAELNRFISTVAMIVFAVQLMFLAKLFFYSIFKGRKVTSTNPWVQTRWSGQHLFGQDMVTGLVKFLKYTVGLMTMVKTVRISYHKPRQSEMMRAFISDRLINKTAETFR